MSSNDREIDQEPVRVLLAEDDSDTILIMTHLLEKSGMAVTHAGDGEQALESALSSKAAGEQFDIILMDLQMPKMDGYSTSSTLRSKGYDGPIIALTARPVEEDQENYRDSGCTHYLIKSEVHNKLISLIRATLSS